MSVSQRIFQKNAVFLFFSIYDENFHLLRSGDKKKQHRVRVLQGEREELGKNGKE